ncbi:MAG: hypothetical protein JO337_11390 [Acidimicrobiales bacterium]|nr:hypothetical protein [Acidimicrobiales bacterium]
MREVLENGIQVLSYLDTTGFDTIPFGLKQKRFRLGDEGDPARPLLLVTHFPPGAVLPRHYHGDVFMDAVVAGSSNIDGEWHEAGTVRWFPAKAMYGPVQAGPQGCVLLEFYTDDAGFSSTRDEEALTDEMRAEIARFTQLRRNQP